MEKYDLKNCCETRQTWPKSLTMRSVIFVDGKNRESARFLQKHNITSFRPVIVKVYIPNDKYLIMPKHIHIIIHKTNGKSLASDVRSFKGLTTKRIGKSIWQV